MCVCVCVFLSNLSCKAHLGFLILEDGTDRQYRNVGEGITAIRWVTSQKSAHIYTTSLVQRQTEYRHQNRSYEIFSSGRHGLISHWRIHHLQTLHFLEFRTHYSIMYICLSGDTVATVWLARWLAHSLTHSLKHTHTHTHHTHSLTHTHTPHTLTHTHSGTHSHTHSHTLTHTLTYTHTHHTQTHTHSHSHTPHTLTHTHLYSHSHTHTHTQLHTHTHTHSHSHTHPRDIIDLFPSQELTSANSVTLLYPIATVTTSTPIHYKAYSVITSNLDDLLWYKFWHLFESSSPFPTFLTTVMRYNLLSAWSNREESCGRGVKHVRGRAELYTGLWWGNLRERDNFEDPCVDGSIILRWIFRKWDVTAWTASMWLRWRVTVNAVMNHRAP